MQAHRRFRRQLAVLVAYCVWPMLLLADEPAAEVTLENVVAPQPNSPDEAVAGEFSLARAVNFLDSAALDWQKSRQCFTCHTNYAYLLARPAVSSEVVAHGQVRAFLEDLVEKRWAEKGPRWDAEVVMSAAILALNDAATTGKLHPTTRKALDRMWTVQNEHGGFDWLKCGWPPMESDDHFGATMAAIGVGAAPESYRDTPAAQEGLAKLRKYLHDTPPASLHHRAMLLWARSYTPDLLTDEEAAKTRDDLLALQKPDGGWSAATLGDWKRGDKKEQDTAHSDGYGTAFSVFVLRRAGVPAEDARVERGLDWLRKNQRASGRWFTRSLNRDNKHYLTHAGTAFAVLVLSEK